MLGEDYRSEAARLIDEIDQLNKAVQSRDVSILEKDKTIELIKVQF